jgi:hypothetical protein
MLTNQDVRAKIEWEGWPSAIEWLDPEEIEDPEVSRIMLEAMGAYMVLDSLFAELTDIIGSDVDE